MLRRLSFTSYKAFAGPTELDLAPITVFLGRNNSGKTALLRLPLYLLDGLSRADGAAPLPVRVRNLSCGSALPELVHKHEPHGNFTVGLDFTVRAQRAMVSLRVQNLWDHAGVRSIVGGLSSQPGLAEPLVWSPTPTSSSGKYTPYSPQRFRGPLPVFGDPEQDAAMSSLSRTADSMLRSFCLLTSTRAGVLPHYELRQPAELFAPDGSEMPYLLASDPALASVVSRWYADALSLSTLRVEASDFGFRLILRDSQNVSTNLAFTGQGTQQLLPVATALALAKSSPYPLVLALEEPELHLHPSLHGAIADLIIAAAASGSQVLVETHSENLLLRLRRRVAEGLLQPESLALVWVEDSPAGSAAFPIEVFRDGTVSSWPAGVFYEDLEEVQAMAKAARTL